MHASSLKHVCTSVSSSIACVGVVGSYHALSWKSRAPPVQRSLGDFGHLTHVGAALALPPAFTPCVSSGHTVHFASPGAAVNFPDAQKTHFVAPAAALIDPSGHFVHVKVVGSASTVPAAQLPRTLRCASMHTSFALSSLAPIAFFARTTKHAVCPSGRPDTVALVPVPLICTVWSPYAAVPPGCRARSSVAAAPSARNVESASSATASVRTKMSKPTSGAFPISSSTKLQLTTALNVFPFTTAALNAAVRFAGGRSTRKREEIAALGALSSV